MPETRASSARDNFQHGQSQGTGKHLPILYFSLCSTRSEVLICNSENLLALNDLALDYIF